MDYALFYVQKGVPRIPHRNSPYSPYSGVPPILNKPLSTILLRVGCTHSVWHFTQVYDIVNESVYQVYSEFRIRNSEFGIRNSEFRIRNSEFRIVNCH